MKPYNELKQQYVLRIYSDEPAAYDLPRYSHLFSSERIDLLNAAIRRVDRTFEELFGDPQG